MNQLLFLSIFLFISMFAAAQDECGVPQSKKTKKMFEAATNDYMSRKFPDASRTLKELTELEPECADAWYLLGMINKKNQNAALQEKYFLKVLELCPDYDVNIHLYLADIYLFSEQWVKAEKELSLFVKDPSKVKEDADLQRARSNLSKVKVLSELSKDPKPFNPVCVEGISSDKDELFPTITVDNEMALYTRKSLSSSQIAGSSSGKYVEKLMFSNLQKDGKYDSGDEMPTPFNETANSGAAALTADNLHLFCVICANEKVNEKVSYYNCDIYSSDNVRGDWRELKTLGPGVNNPDTWESQVSVSADGNSIFFISDRKGGIGGYDIWKSTKKENGDWGNAVNLGPVINSKGNEYSPFIHTDSQTLYFSSGDKVVTDESNSQTRFKGHPGLGGYDIFFSKLSEKGEWSQPKNIGFPINTQDDEKGFFVSTDGKKGYFVSNNKAFNGKGGLDLFSFDLYEAARPEKVLVVKGDITDRITNQATDVNIEMVNVQTKKITKIPYDTNTGKYVIAMAFNNDYLLKVKKPLYAPTTEYFGMKDTTLEAPKKVDIEVKQVFVGEPYEMKNIN
ncbi:MAG: hypothetical protein V2A54_08615, partial [Bacteroidota bacterium]